MESPIDVVRRFCAAWSDNVSTVQLAAFFADDAVYQNVPLAPITGRDAIANNIASFIRPGPPGIEAIEFRIVHIAASPVDWDQRRKRPTIWRIVRAENGPRSRMVVLSIR